MNPMIAERMRNEIDAAALAGPLSREHQSLINANLVREASLNRDLDPMRVESAHTQLALSQQQFNQHAALFPEQVAHLRATTEQIQEGLRNNRRIAPLQAQHLEAQTNQINAALQAGISRQQMTSIMEHAQRRVDQRLHSTGADRLVYPANATTPEQREEQRRIWAAQEAEPIIRASGQGNPNVPGPLQLQSFRAIVNSPQFQSHIGQRGGNGVTADQHLAADTIARMQRILDDNGGIHSTLPADARAQYDSLAATLNRALQPFMTTPTPQGVTDAVRRAVEAGGGPAPARPAAPPSNAVGPDGQPEPIGNNFMRSVFGR